MATGFQESTDEPNPSRTDSRQQLVPLPPGPVDAPVLDAVDDAEFYDDGLDDATSAGATGKTAWVRLLGLLLLLSISFSLGALATKNSTKPLPVGPIVETSKAAAGGLVVHVTGRVKSPGVYTLPFEARINDAINRAGGPLPDADLNAVNLAAWVEDGTRLEVPAKAAAPRIAQSPVTLAEPLPAPALSTPEVAQDKESPAPAAIAPPHRAASAPRAASGPRAPKGTKARKDDVPRAVTASGAESANASPEFLEKHPIDLNTATNEQLQMLPGVGPAMAEKILTHRTENGRFNSVDDLDDVPGIGAKTLEKLRPLVTVK